MKICLFIPILMFIFSCKKSNLATDEGNDFVEKTDLQIRQETGYIKTDNIKLLNLGFPGYKASGLLEEEQLVLNEHPDLVILMCGTNEAILHDTVNYRSNMVKIIDDIKKTNADVILLTPPPLVDPGKNSLLNDVIRSIRAIATEKNCYLIDINVTFSAFNFRKYLLLGDGVHPAPFGYNLIAEQILFTYVKNKLTKRKIVCFGDSITYGSFVAGEGSVIGDSYPAQLSRLLNN